MTKQIQRMKIKQNQTFFHGTYTTMTSFFNGRNIVKYFNDFYDWHLLISRNIDHKQLK